MYIENLTISLSVTTAAVAIAFGWFYRHLLQYQARNLLNLVRSPRPVIVYPSKEGRSRIVSEHALRAGAALQQVLARQHFRPIVELAADLLRLDPTRGAYLIGGIRNNIHTAAVTKNLSVGLEEYEPGKFELIERAVNATYRSTTQDEDYSALYVKDRLGAEPLVAAFGIHGLGTEGAAYLYANERRRLLKRVKQDLGSSSVDFMAILKCRREPNGRIRVEILRVVVPR
jgi:hypothetical protein